MLQQPDIYIRAAAGIQAIGITLDVKDNLWIPKTHYDHTTLPKAIQRTLLPIFAH